MTDTCSAGVCGGAARDCSAFADQCNDGTCDEAAGRCEATPKANGTACDDGSACSQTDTCQAGLCLGGDPVVCTAQDACHLAGFCDPATGTCSNPTIAPCDDGDACTADSCDPAAGCVFQPVTGLEAATCLMVPQAFCQPIPPAVAKWIARAQHWIARAQANGDPLDSRPYLERAARAFKKAGKKTVRLANKRRLSPACAQALGLNLFEARSRIEQLRKPH